jgi:hypothetical protein
MKEPPSFDDQIEYLEEFRNIRNRYMAMVLGVRNIHEAARSSEGAAAAQREYDRLVRNDDKLLEQLEALQQSKAQA